MRLITKSWYNLIHVHITIMMNYSEFLRIYEVRCSSMMWFLGAGCSISAGIPSAWDIIWDCKRRIFCSEQGVARSKVEDINNPAIQQLVQDHLISKNNVPKFDDEDEYSYYFEKAISSKADRQIYIKEIVSKASPSYGHLVLASLAKTSQAPIVWTTNFDKLYENAIYKIYGSTNDLVVADLGEPKKATTSLKNSSFPLLIKLHGDFHSERLKNTKPELQSQDEEMRKSLKKAADNLGLCVAGYSGRDKSIMDTLKESVEAGSGFPHGIYWFIRSNSKPFKSVTDLIELAKKNGVDAELVEINTFDEAMDGIRRYLPAFPNDIEDILKPETSRITEAPLMNSARKPPYLRLNALRIDAYPNTCKLVTCDIGGYKEIEKCVTETNANILARRVRQGVITFGKDDEIRKAFSGHNFKRISLYPIDPAKLTYPSEESKLINDAFCKALERQTGLVIEERRDGKYIVSQPEKTSLDHFNKVTTGTIEALSGIVPGTQIEWKEACKIQLDYKFDKLWFNLTPRVLLYFPENSSIQHINKAKSFTKEKTAPRALKATGKFTGYNSFAASILAGWMSVITQNTKNGSVKLSSLGIGEGIDAQFELSTSTVISGSV